MAKAKGFSGDDIKRVVRAVQRVEKLPPPSISAGQIPPSKREGVLRWGIVKETYGIPSGGVGKVAAVNNSNVEITDSEKDIYNFYSTTVWEGSFCGYIESNGQRRIVTAEPATELICRSNSNILAGTSSFTAVVLDVLDGYFPFTSITVINLLGQSFSAGEPFLALWDEENERWVVIKYGDSSVNAGCGLDKSGNTLNFVPAEVAGAGLVADPANGTGDCYLAVNPGCGLMIASDRVEVDAAQLAGKGLKVTTGTDPSACALEVKVGNCGVIIGANDSLGIDPSKIAGTGLIAESLCGIAVNAGCGLNFADDKLVINLNTIAGDGLTPDPNNGANDTCFMMVEIGCGLKYTGTSPDRVIEVDVDDLDGPGLYVYDNSSGKCELGIKTGCGLIVNGNDLEVNYGAGLTCTNGVLEATGTNFTDGCGIIISGGVITVDNTALAGYGLKPSEQGCAIDLDIYATCGIILEDNNLKLDIATIAGSGLKAETECQLAIDHGCGLILEDEILRINYGDGLYCEDGVLKATGTPINAGCGITISSNTVSVNASQIAGAGLVAGTGCLVDVNTGCGLIVNGDLLEVNYGTGLTCTNGVLEATGISLTEGCGINIAGGVISADPADLAGDGLEVGTGCYLNIAEGCGLKLTGTSPNKFLEVNAGDGLECSADVVAVKLGCGTKFDSGALAVDNTQLDGTGLVPEGDCKLGIDTTVDSVETINSLTGCQLELDTVSNVLRLTLNFTPVFINKNADGIPISTSTGSSSTTTCEVGIEPCP